MSSVSTVDDRYRLHGDFGGVTVFNNDVLVRLEEEVARCATQKGSSYECASFEGVTGVELLLKLTLTSWTSERSIESVESLSLKRQNVTVPLDGSHNFGGVHLFEDGHGSYARCARMGSQRA